MIYLYKGFTPLQFQYLLFHFAGRTFYCQFAAVELPRPVQSKLKPGYQPRAPQAIFPLGGFWIFSPRAGKCVNECEIYFVEKQFYGKVVYFPQ